jgi:uncharacterized protein
MHGEVCWLEVNSKDAPKTKAFYQTLFGWKDGPGDVGFPYHFLKSATGEKNFGGIMPHAADSPVPPHWLVYFAVTDLDAALAHIVKLGGKIQMPATPLAGAGKIAVAIDPVGAAFAIFQGA